MKKVEFLSTDPKSVKMKTGARNSKKRNINRVGIKNLTEDVNIQKNAEKNANYAENTANVANIANTAVESVKNPPKSPVFSFLDYRNYFLFFLFFAICGYISLMVSSDPYNDDYCRNFTSLHVGTLSSLRCLTFLFENIMYLNGPITDASPFTQLIACAFLACTAVICMRIFNVNKLSKWEILCLAPIVVNPFLLEVMMYHFDSPFITFALCLVVFSAYLSSLNSRRWLFVQSMLLFLSLFIYQAAFSAYLIIFLYKFMKEIEIQTAQGKPFYASFYKMRYWIYSLILCLLLYVPFVAFISYCKDASGNIFIIPNSLENCSRIIANVGRYLSIIYNDWCGNLAGQIFSYLFCIFVIMFIVRICRLSSGLPSKLSSPFKIFNTICAALMLLCLSFALLMAPCGVYPFLSSAIFVGNISIPPRVMCSMGILLAIILRENYFTFSKMQAFGRNFYRFIVAVLALWSVIFINSAGNIIHYFRILEDFVIYDISKDIFEETRSNKEILKLCFKGAVLSPAISNFARAYPMIDRIIPEKWHAPTYCRMALMNPYFPILDGTGENYIEDEYKYSEKKKLKETMWYTSYIVDKKLLLFELKGESKWSDPATPILKVFRDGLK